MCDVMCNGCDNVKCEHITLHVTMSWEDPNGFSQGGDMAQLTILKDCCGCRVYVGSKLEGLRGGGQTSWRLLQLRQEMVVPGLR